MQTAISVRNVTKTYSQGATAVRALKGVDLDVQPGEIVLLMGPSGSGKTTLLSIMGCILQPSTGTVLIHGRQVSGLNEKDLPQVRRKHVGFIFQGFNLFPTLTAGENVELTLDVKGVTGREARRHADVLLERVGLTDKRHVFPADLSGGEKQRVAIARALAGDPDIILADEPTAALDFNTGSSVIALLRDLAHERGRAVVIVTHDIRLQEFSDRVVHIEDGNIQLENMPGMALAAGERISI